MKRQGDPDFEDAFIREIKDEMKNENLKKMWDSYGLYIIIFVVAVLTATVSFESIKAWREKSHNDLSNTYAYALSLQNQGKYDESLSILKNIQDSTKGVYADLAEVQTSNILFEQNKPEEGIIVLENIIKDKNTNSKIRDVSIIKLVSYKLDTAPSQEIKDLLNPLIQANSSWTNIAKELLAMLAIRDGDIDGAKTIYTEISNTNDVPENLKTRAKDMLSVLEEAKTK